MKRLVIGIVAVLGLVAAAITNSVDSEPLNDYVAHEWGTFTSVSGSDGEQLNGLFLEEERLPGFVHEARMPINMVMMKFRGAGLPVDHLKGVNIKMETPVIYFYSKNEGTVNVNVKLKGGIMNQWYPAAVEKRDKGLDLGTAFVKDLHKLDFYKNYIDSIDWKVKVLSPDSSLSYTSRQNQETPTWINPRFTDANMLQIGKEREKFIFYRGLARFRQPFKVTAQSSSQITLKNTGKDKIGFALVYEYTKEKKAKVWWTGSLEGDENKVVAKNELDTDEAIHGEFLKGLIAAGLYEKEAKAMLETWRHSYFEKEGLRVFWIVPRKFTDEILPLKMNPVPEQLERVLVGRTEVLTPEFEQKLVKDFMENKEFTPYWLNSSLGYGTPDRYFKAWQSRVEQLLEHKTHKFSFLSKITSDVIRPGEFMITEDKEKKGHLTLTQLGIMMPRMNYIERSGKIDGQATFFFQEPETNKIGEKVSLLIPKKAVFNMKNGQLDGECKIYDISDNNNQVLVETKFFKDGKVL